MKTNITIKRIALATHVFCGVLFTVPLAQAGIQTLPGHVPPVAASLQSIGRLNPTNQIYLAIGLRLPDPQALLRFLDQLYDPQNPNFRHYLTPEQFTETFGPTKQDYQAVLDFAVTNGLAVSQTHPNRLLVNVTASVADIERAFHVTLLEYRYPTEARTFCAPNVEPSIAAAIPVLHISGLNSFGRPYRPDHVSQNPTQANGGSGPNGYAGYDFRNAYLPNVSLTGTGQFVGLLEFDDYYHPPCAAYDATLLYQSQYMNPNPNLTPTIVPVDGGVPTCSAYQEAIEVAADIEMAIAMAPGLAGILVYEAPEQGSPPTLTSAGIDDILSAMAYPVRALQLSSSWVLRDTDPNADEIYLEFAAQGQSFFQASGDDGAFCWNPQYPQRWADSPYITIVGGTTLSTTGPGGSWVSEGAWSGSGGGISPNYAIPNWQQGINGGSTTMRNIPDVAMVADQIQVVLGNLPGPGFTGTSAAAPLWAGFTALANQNALADGKAPIGFLNPALYAIGKWSGYLSFFHDITSGNNYNTCSPTAFPAATGYDLCTGWGSPTPNLINGLLTPDCPLTPYGLVSWWPGQGNTMDNQNNNTGVAEGGLSYAAGEVNQAFSLNGMDADVRVPASATLDVGAGSGFSVESWINSTSYNPYNPSQVYPIVQWLDAGNKVGTVLFKAIPGGGLELWMVNPANGLAYYLDTPAGMSLIVPNVWQHVAFTYDENSGVASLYVNGVQMAQGNLGSFRPTTTGDFYIGQYRSGGNYWRFAGLLDEVSVYNMVLTPETIMAIWNARSSGKCCPNCG